MSIGIDRGSVDGGLRDYRAAYAAGIRWVTLRAEFALGHHEVEDPDWARDADAAQEAGLQVAAYIFPGHDKGDPEPRAQMDGFAATIGKYVVPGVSMVPAYDVEFERGIAATGFTRDEHVARIREFVQCGRDIWDCWVKLYLSARVWNTDDTDTLGNPDAPDLFPCSPWVAHYGAPVRSPAVLEPQSRAIPWPAAPNTWGFYWEHQYQGDALRVPGLTSTADLTRFRLMLPSELGPRATWVDDRLDAFFRAHPEAGAPPRAAESPACPHCFEDRVKAFQRISGLVADGIVGHDSHRVLSWVNP